MLVEDPAGPVQWKGTSYSIVMGDDYPYAADGMLLWNELHTWLHAYLSSYYRSQADLVKDTELQAWCVSSSKMPLPHQSIVPKQLNALAVGCKGSNAAALKAPYGLHPRAEMLRAAVTFHGDSSMTNFAASRLLSEHALAAHVCSLQSSSANAFNCDATMP